MNNKIRDIARQTTEFCVDEAVADPWIWEETFGRLMIDKCVKFLKDINSDFEAEQLEEFWQDVQ